MASASTPASASIESKKEKLSFAKIAAAGIKPAKPAPTNTNPNISSPPRDGPIPTPSDVQSPTIVKSQKLVQVQTQDTSQKSPHGPEVRVQVADSALYKSTETASDGLLIPAASEDGATQVSSSSDSNKPPSMDGKSVASGTTFALDEKDSLRPDDSASVKAAEDEDLYSASGSGMPSRMGSDDGVRAFRDQLREISSMEPSRRGGPPQPYAAAARGVLYVPPQCPGVGTVPSTARGEPAVNQSLEAPPDPKLLEALDSARDRVWVLKLEQDVIDFVKDAGESSLTLPQCHAFYRLLAHKMADYYMLGHFVDDTTNAVRLYKTPSCRIPPPLTGITAPSTAASTPPPSGPAMKILRRGVDGPAIANGSNMQSKNGSENDDSGDEKKAKGPVTREEREARYEAARLRIMGSAKPADSPELPKEMQDSRSSSATGKKIRKKAREDNDDGFEARSAYSNYFTSYGSDGAQTPSYGIPPTSDPTSSQYQHAYAPQQPPSGYQPMPAQGIGNHWMQQCYPNIDPTQAWAQGQTGAYDMSADFQRAMSFQNQPAGPTSPMNFGQGFAPSFSQNFSPHYGQQQYYGNQQPWQQQQYPGPAPGSVPIPAPGSGQTGYSYPPTATSPPGHSQEMQSYAFGQLPSQTFPGRSPSNHEHPLPGSYKGKNFNPQSQTFVPGLGDERQYSPHAAAQNTHAGFTSTFPAQPAIAQPSRHNSVLSQSSNFGPPVQNMQPMNQPPRVPGQPMIHPLPQGPVFPKQPSPNVPLPPKPGMASHPSMQPMQSQNPSPNTHQQQAQNESILSKWGAPASLPAKPPPPQGYAAAAVPRAQGGFSPYGQMAGNAIVNGTGMKR